MSCSTEDLVARLQELEEQQQETNEMMLRLTTRFSQVQFRIYQCARASTEDQPKLLEALQEFAFASCDVDGAVSEEGAERSLVFNREEHERLILLLEKQLQALEHQSSVNHIDPKVLQRKRIVIDQLRCSLEMKFDDLGLVSVQELRRDVNDAIETIAIPAQLNEDLASQLRVQAEDMERFARFIQQSMQSDPRTTVTLPKVDSLQAPPSLLQIGSAAVTKAAQSAADELHITETSSKRTMAKSKEPAVDPAITAVVLQLRECCDHIDAVVGEVPEARSHIIGSKMVRGSLSLLMAEIFRHGSSNSKFHPYDIFTAYYKLEDGAAYNKLPARQLTNSFGDTFGGVDVVAKRSPASAHIPPVGGSVGTGKAPFNFHGVRESLLAAVHLIDSSHDRFKRSKDVKFRSLLCVGLNEHRLYLWCNLIAETAALTAKFYKPASYIRSTKLHTVIEILAGLRDVPFRLAVDEEIRHLKDSELS